jgi:hypothetical protein
MALTISLIILLFFLAFIFAGIVGFTVSVRAVVSSSIPLSGGALVVKMRNPGDLQSKLGEVAARIALAVNIFTINEL